ncbi:hypothetical protein LOK49_LG10G02111 [Camellia lanceoleosa]|uniref:Uncharacterized protein n=1 Tax=Camellia lanceoleosa TaxID=1840588 RepID=A0ACC0G8Z7_9ERIC|nr:hypothetical protein LOK49_LG10G02111 [Camellia lanceoleosa]
MRLRATVEELEKSKDEMRQNIEEFRREVEEMDDKKLNFMAMRHLFCSYLIMMLQSVGSESEMWTMDVWTNTATSTELCIGFWLPKTFVNGHIFFYEQKSVAIVASSSSLFGEKIYGDSKTKSTTTSSER